MIAIDRELMNKLNLVANIGLALLQIQQVEKILMICTTYFLTEPDATLAMIQAEEDAARRKMLGQLIGKLRNRIDVDPDFDEVLAEFLANRNTFIHDLHRVPGFAVDTDEGVRVGLEFVNKLTQQAAHVRKVLAGLTGLLGGEYNLHTGGDAELNKAYEQIASIAFRPKE